MIATPTWGTSSSILEYHKESQDNYYRQEGDLGVWQGKAAKALGFTGAVTEKDLQNALLGKNAQGEKALKQVSIGKDGERERAGLDLTFNAPKSVSIAYELAKATGNEELAKAILDIHNDAVTKSLNGIENKYAQSRQTKDGITEHIDTKNLAIAKFQHDTARPVTDEKGNVSVDPSLHTHAVIMNMTKSADGTYKAIESNMIFQHYMAEGMNYRATMAAELQKAGFEITITDENKGFYEINLTGDREKDEKLLKSLSQRSEQIEKALPALREKYPYKTESELKQMAAHQTREFKGEIDRDKVRADNLQRAESLGMGVENINDLAQKIQRQKETVANMSPEQKEAKEFTELHKAKDVVAATLTAITQEKSAFKMEEVTELSQKFLLSDAISPDILKKAIQEQFKDKSDLRLLNIGNKHYTTREILNQEKQILDHLKESKDIYKPSHSKAAAKRELEEYSSKQTHALTKGQLESAAHILSSKDLIIGIQGDAGTGKTTMLKAVNELKGDIKVYGLSYTGKAAKEIENATKEKQKEQSSDQLLKSSGIESSTLASFLNKVESGKLDKAEFKGAKLIVDEASMLGIKDANKLLSFAKDAGVQVVMIGDVKQFKAINAGDPFSLMQNNKMDTKNMSEVIRQKDRTLIAAVAQLNNYNTDAAFEILDKAKMIHELKGDESVIDKIKEDYFAYHEKADKDKVNDTIAIASVKDTLKNNVILTQTNKVKDELNKTIRDEMKERELVSRDEFKFKTRESTGLTPAQKYFAANYKEATNIFLQSDIYIYDGKKVDKLEKGKEYEIQERDTKNNTLQVKDKEGNSFRVDLKKNSQAIQAYRETERSFSHGDKIVFEKNDKKIGIENGTIGKIQSVDKEGNITIETEDKTVKFNMDEYNYLNHGYAVTTYKAQGASADNVMAYMPAKGQNANSFYVTVTRAVENLKIYTDDKDDLRSAIHNEQIKDNAHSLNDRLEKKEAARVQKQQEAHEQRKLSREEAFSNAPSSKKQLSFAEGIAKELGIENPDIGKRANTDQFIKDNLEIYQASKEQKQLEPPSDKQAAFAQTIADKLYDDIDTSKMNVKQTKEYISANVEEFKDAVKNPVQHMLNVDVSKLSQVQEDKYFMDLVHTELVSAYKKDLDSLEKLDQKHEQVFPQVSLEEKQMKLDLYATALDIKPKDYLDAMVKEHTSLQFEETIQKYGLNTPQGMAKELKDQGLIYQDEKYRAMADLIVERQFDKFMEKHDGSNGKEFEDRNARMIEFTESYKEQLTEVREYEGKISSIEEMLESGDIYKAVAMIEEHREYLEEYDLANLEKELEKVMESEFVHVQDELEKEFEMQEEFLSNELEEYDKTDDKEQDKDDEHIQEIEQDDKELDIATEDKQNDKEHIELEDEYDYDR